MNNTAIVTKINKLEEIPGMDNIQLAKLFGTQVIVSKQVNEGDIMIYVDSNMKMSPEFLKNNNLYRHSNLNKDPNKSGYFEDNGRVKTIKMKGVISDGFLFPGKMLEYTGLKLFENPKAKPGYEFNEWNGFKICEKYIPETKQKQPKEQRGKGPKSKMFVKHFETDQFMRNMHKIPPRTICYIEEKIHGTSARVGNVKVQKEYKGLKRLISKYFFQTKSYEEYDYLSGTRRTIIRPNLNKPDSEKSEREEIHESLQVSLKKGEQVYFEIFGYNKKGSQIQKEFPYGCHPKNEVPYRKILYRVTLNNENGEVVDYPREYVYSRAEELGFEKPYLFEKFYYSGTSKSLENLQKKIIEYAQGQSAMADDTLKEGVVIWFINENGRWKALKYKSDEYRLKESKLKDKGTYDTEEFN